MKHFIIQSVCYPDIEVRGRYFRTGIVPRRNNFACPLSFITFRLFSLRNYVAISPRALPWVAITSSRSRLYSLSSDREKSHRDGNGDTHVHPLFDPGSNTAGPGTQFEVYGAVLDDGQHLHDGRLRDHALLRLQQRPIDQQRQAVLLSGATAALLRDRDIRHRRYWRCKFHVIDVLVYASRVSLFSIAVIYER